MRRWDRDRARRYGETSPGFGDKVKQVDADKPHLRVVEADVFFKLNVSGTAVDVDAAVGLHDGALIPRSVDHIGRYRHGRAEREGVC